MLPRGEIVPKLLLRLEYKGHMSGNGAVRDAQAQSEVAHLLEGKRHPFWVFEYGATKIVVCRLQCGRGNLAPVGTRKAILQIRSERIGHSAQGGSGVKARLWA